MGKIRDTQKAQLEFNLDGMLKRGLTESRKRMNQVYILGQYCRQKSINAQTPKSL